MALNKYKQRVLYRLVFAVLLLLLVDQTSKLWVKTHMMLGQSIDIFSWFKIYFTENPGMAFGIELFDTYILTVFRLIIVSILGYYIVKLLKKGFKAGFLMCLAMIFAGAVGNIIDTAFYGVLFDHSYGQLATFLPSDGGYSTFLHGKVVDMLYFPLIDTVLPSWVPVWGGKEFVFFRPIFNIADSSICVSVFVLLLFYRKTLSESLAKENKMNDE